MSSTQPLTSPGKATRRNATAPSAIANRAQARKRYRVAGVLLGIGFGGFVDGIVLHQILQWHHMLTSTGEHPATTIAGLETNTLWTVYFT